MRSDKGFTLLEVMIAVTILVFMMAIAYGTITESSRARRKYGHEQDRWREARMAMTRISHELEMAYVSMNEDRSLMLVRTFFIGQGGGDVDSLSFSSFAHNHPYADAHESDQTIISYYPAADQDDSRVTDLMRRETRRLANDKPESIPGEADPVFTNVSKFKLSYWDARNQAWQDSWSTQADGAGTRLPDKVKIALTFVDDNGKPVTLTTESRVFLQEAVQNYAN
jgi:general secretion pathway protein J